jgi:hypothetical protein
MEAALAERKTAAATRIAELERQAGVALLDSGDVPEEMQDEIAAQRAELISVEHAEGELVRRQREAAAAEHAARIKTWREAFAAQERKRLEAVARAHTAASHLVSSLRDALSASKEQMIIGGHLGKAPPVQLSDFDKRLSWLLSGLLAKVSGNPAKFGDMSLSLPYVHDWRIAHERDWRDLEQKQLAGVLAEISPATEGI